MDIPANREDIRPDFTILIGELARRHLKWRQVLIERNSGIRLVGLNESGRNDPLLRRNRQKREGGGQRFGDSAET